MSSIIEAIIAINPDAEVSVNGEDYKQIIWHNDTPEISEKDIKAKQKELDAEYVSNEYQRQRKTEYPKIADQLDDIYHNGIDGWKEKIKAIKDKYPKE